MVRANLAVSVLPLETTTVAVTVYPPANAFAVKVPASATPLEFVQTEMEVPPPPKVPLAAVGVGGTVGGVTNENDGAAKVTYALVTGFGGVLPSTTVTERGTAKAVPFGVVCGVAPVPGVIVTGTSVFDRVKVAVDPSPSMVEAVTV